MNVIHWYFLAYKTLSLTPMPLNLTCCGVVAHISSFMEEKPEAQSSYVTYPQLVTMRKVKLRFLI